MKKENNSILIARNIIWKSRLKINNYLQNVVVNMNKEMNKSYNEYAKKFETQLRSASKTDI
jgi:hypothetical protein